VRQVYLSLPPPERSNICLHIHLVQAVKLPRSPLLASSFTIEPLDWEKEPDRPKQDDPGSFGLFQLYIEGTEYHKEWIQLEEDCLRMKPLRRYRYYPQWPWLFAHCCAVGDLHPAVSETRLYLLLAALDDFGDPRGYLNEFTASKTARKWEISKVKFDRWMNLMYPVTSAIGAPYHSPCDYLTKRYGHLV
jgi:hypothetical protein